MAIKKDYQEIVGKSFGCLIVQEILPHVPHTNRMCEVRCSCGTVFEVRVGNILSGNTASCGCTRGKRQRHDLTGKTFGYWTVLYRIESDDRHSKWMCECSCGNKKEVYQDNLTGKKSISCGCQQQEHLPNFKDRTGTTQGKLFVIRRAENKDKQRRGVWWECRCVCGKELTLSTSQLYKRVSCGCGMWAERTIVDITGNKYGKLTAIRRVARPKSGSNKQYWLCRCDCGNDFVVIRANLTSGNTRSCGCLDDRENGHPVSQQQRKIHEMLGGELNYRMGLFSIDIAFPEKKYAIEYDSHYWHSKKKDSDQRKEEMLKESGWKLFRILSVYSVPTKEQLEGAIQLLDMGLPSVELVMDDWYQRDIRGRRND